MRSEFVLAAMFLFLIGSTSVNAESPTRTIVMPYKLVGNVDAQLDSEHKTRLEMADAALRKGLQATGQYELIDEAAAQAYSEKVITALNNNACDHCESVLAKELHAKFIIAPYVYRLSQLVLTMHFVILDADTGKTLLKKALDFRGDNDQAWLRAIDYFIKNVNKP